MAWFGKKQKSLAVVVTCADWRLHQRKVDLNARLGKLLGVDGVDFLVVPGPDGLILAERCAEWSATLAQTKFLIKAHAPVARLAVVAHERCAGHPVSDDQHVVDAKETARELKAATGFDGKVHAVLMRYRSDTEWDLDVIAEY